MLEFVNIKKVFDTDLFSEPFEALKSISFKVEKGKIVGFLGANGAGKTTSLKIAMDFIRPTSGEVIFDSSLGNKKLDIFKKIGFLPERPYFYPHLTGREFCHFMGKLSGVDQKELEKNMLTWAKRLKIDHALNREIKNYSKGMLQRVGFVVTLLHNPEFIILDEPLSGLDPIGRKELKDIISEVNNLGKTVFFSSHIISDVEEICDNVIFLKEGEVYYDGTVNKIIEENIKSDSVIRYKKGNNYLSCTVDNSNKQNKIENLISNGNEIISVNVQRPTLEEIIYNVK